MTATAHALIGGIIASSVGNPPLGLALAAVSHPLADMIPHWDFGYNWKKKSTFRLFIEASLDLLVGCSLSFWLFGQNVDFFYFWVIIFLSQFWDIAEVPYWLFKWRFAPFSWIEGFQSMIQSKLDKPWGIITQVLTVVLLWIITKIF